MAIKKWIGTDGSYSTAGNWSPSGVPIAADTVRIPAGGGNISSGLAQSGVALTAFIVETGYTGTIGSSAGYLEITTSRFEFSGGGLSYIDLKASAVSPQILSTASGGTGTRGLYLIGTAIAVLNVVDGSVGVAVNAGEVSTITTASVVSGNGSLWLGTGVTLTNWDQHGGNNIVRCAGTQMDIYGGTCITQEVGAWTTQNVYGGTLTSNSTGTVTALNSYGGTIDHQRSDAARTITALNKYAGGAVRINKEAVTYTAVNIMESQTLSG